MKLGRIVLLAVLATAFFAPRADAKVGKVLAIRFDAEVNPVTQKWLGDRIKDGASYDAVIILLDTPGGLEDSMRKIVQAELTAT